MCLHGSDLNPSESDVSEIFVRVDPKSKGNYVCTGSISDSLHLRPFSKWDLLLREITCSQSSSLRKPQI